MIVQDVTALLTFNPHGGPITHSSTGSKPDSPVPPVSTVDDIPVATDGRELCLWARLVQRAGKWFSSSLALGIDVVDI